MRIIIILFFSAGLFTLSTCQSHQIAQKAVAAAKATDTVKAATSALNGKWKLVQTLIDTGDGKGTWQPVKGKAAYVIFDRDARLSGSVYPGYMRYKVKDSAILVFITRENVIQNYRYQIKGDTLTTSLAGPIFCREACGIKLVKVSN